VLYVIFGSDGYGSREAASALLSRDAGDDSASGVSRFDGSTLPWTKLQEACGSLSLFAGRQVILVNNLLEAWSARGEAAAGKGSNARPSPADFVEFAKALPATTDLILHEGELSQTNRYLKGLAGLPADQVNVQECSAPKDPARREAWAGEWMRRTVGERGGSIENRAIKLLVERCGSDFQHASHEIDKLLAYTAPLYGITSADVELLVADVQETRGFDLVDAVAAKQAARVVDLTDRLVTSGQAPEQLFALISARVRDLCLLASASAEHVKTDMVLAHTGWQPWRLKQLERSLSRFTAEDLQASQTMLVAADLALKSRPSHERPLVLLLTLLAITQRSDPTTLANAFAY
jgi:DNA polymerase III delta subunit